MQIDSLKEDPWFLRLFFQAIFDIIIKPIQWAWSHREKTIHGYVAAILAIGIFLYFLIVWLYGSVNFFYWMFYEDQFNKNLQHDTTEALNKIFTDPNKYWKDYLDFTKTGSLSRGNWSFYPIGTPRKAQNTCAYKLLFLFTDTNESGFNFLSVTLEGNSWFKKRIVDMSIINTISIWLSWDVNPKVGYDKCYRKILHDINEWTGNSLPKCSLIFKEVQNF